MKKITKATMPEQAITLRNNNNMALPFLLLSLLALLPFLGWTHNHPTRVADEPVAPAFEDIEIYRLQVKFETCNNNDAGTDDDVYIQMNDDDDRFFLDKWTNDFVKGKSNSYDILTKSIRHIRDIRYLKVGLRGDDATCFRRIEVYVNNNRSPLFAKSYSGHGQWIDDSQSFTIDRNELQAYSGWKYTDEHKDLWKPPSKRISKATILMMVNCSVGNQLNHQQDIAWGSKEWGLPNTLFGDGVEVKYVNSNTLHFDLDLQMKMHGPNPEVDVDFDLVFSCVNGRIQTEVKNLSSQGVGIIYELQRWVREKGVVLVGTAIGTELGNPGVGAAAGGFVSKYLNLSLNLDINHPDLSRPCASIEVTENCDVLVTN
jgi:hypothetical protein